MNQILGKKIKQVMNVDKKGAFKMNIIGIDAGSSLTKIVETKGKNIINSMMIANRDIKEVLDIFINRYNIEIEEIEKIVLTGVGVGDINENLYDIETIKVDDFVAIGTGGTSLAGITEALVISIGTGTAFVRVEGEKITHIGGSRSWRRNLY